MNIGGGEFGWMTTRGFRNVCMMFRPDTSDGRSMKASDGSNLMCRMVTINESKDIGNIGTGQGLHS